MLRDGEDVRLKNPEAIAQARQNPDYRLRDNSDGSVSVTGIQIDGQWHEQNQSAPAKPKTPARQPKAPESAIAGQGNVTVRQMPHPAYGERRPIWNVAVTDPPAQVRE